MLSKQGNIPEKYLPDFSYYKIAVNEIPKRALVRIRNALSVIFQIENSRPEELKSRMSSLVQLLKNETPEVIRLFSDWFIESKELEIVNEHVNSINDLMEVSTMWATAIKEHDSRVRIFEKQEILIEQITLKFGLTDKAKKQILATMELSKLDKAVKKFALAATREEVLKCLD